MAEEQRPWHQLFGLSWEDFFRGTSVRVELEKDLSHRQQLLDLVILRAEGGPLPRRPPDGFEDLAAHNLVSFKSYQEALDGWALNELVAHYVNYRKQVSPSMQELLPEADFRLFAICVRVPRGLAGQVALEAVQPGVSAVRHFTGVIRIVVIHELPQAENNAMLHLFSANEELAAYGARHYRPHSRETSTLLHQLFERYQKEGLPMWKNLEELYRQTVEEVLKTTPPEKRLEGLTPEQRLVALQGLTADERVEGLTAEQRVEGLTADDLLRALPPEVRAALAQRLKDEASGPPQ